MRLVAGLLLTMAAVVMSTAAFAHAVLLETSPADGAVLTSAPSQLRLTFNEPVRPIFLRLIDNDGQQRLPADAIQAEDATITAAVPPLDDGGYIVSWRAVSVDGHPIGGSFTFRIGAGQATSVANVASNAETGWLIASGMTRFLVYALTLLASGAALFVVLVLRGRTVPVAMRRYVLLSAVGAAIALVLSLGVEGGLLALGPWTSIFDPAVWRLGASGSTGSSVLLSLIGIVLIMAGIWRRAAVRSALLLIGAVVVTAGLGQSGHAATASPRWLTTPAVVLHALVAAFWVGAFWPLLWHLRRRQLPDAAVVVRRFSRLAVVAVAVLVLAGIVLAIVQLGSVAALWQTNYGLILLAKLLAVLVLFALAALNKLRLTPPLARNNATAGGHLRRSIGIEMAVAAVVLAATAALGTVPPPRALAMQGAHADSGYGVTVAKSSYTARIEVTPARPGVNTITVRLTGDDGAALKPLQTSLELALPAMGIEPITRELEPAGAGAWRYSGPALSLPGRWTLRIKVLVSAFERVAFEATVPIR